MSRSNYNVSDDEEEYSDSSLPEEEEEKSALLRLRTMRGEGGGIEDDEDVALKPTHAEVAQLNDSKKEMFAEIINAWFPKDKAVYVRPWEDEEEEENGNREEEEEEEDEVFGSKNKRKETTLEERQRKIESFVEEAYEQCNQFGRAIGEQGMHCLLQNKDYRNGWNDFKRFFEDIFCSDKYDVDFFHANSTNYWDLTWDGNYDSLSMKKMGYVVIGPSISVMLGNHRTVKSIDEWKIPDEDTWKRTIRNSGFSHVTIVPVDYEVIISKNNKVGREEKERGEEGEEKKERNPVWIYDPDFDVKRQGTKSSILFKPASITGSKNVKVYVDDQEIESSIFFRTNKDEKLCRLFRVIVNFVGQPKAPAWWNTKSKWELAEENLRCNVDAISDVQKRLENLDIVKTAKQKSKAFEDSLDPESYENVPPPRPLPLPSLDTGGKQNGATTPNTNPVTIFHAPKRKRSTGSSDAISSSQTTTTTTTTTTTIVPNGDSTTVRPHKKRRTKKRAHKIQEAAVLDKFEPLDAFLASKFERRDNAPLLDGRIFTEETANGMIDDSCFDLYVSYLQDLVESHLGTNDGQKKTWRIGRFFSNSVVPNISDVCFTFTKSRIHRERENEPVLCGFSGTPIEGTICHVVKCYTSDASSENVFVGVPFDAFTVGGEKNKLEAMTLFLKAVKHYKRMINLRLDGESTGSFSDGLFFKHLMYMHKFKRFVTSINNNNNNK